MRVIPLQLVDMKILNKLNWNFLLQTPLFKVDYQLPVTCSDFNSTTVNSLGLDFIDLLPVTISISYRCLNVVSNTDLYVICSHYYHFF